MDELDRVFHRQHVIATRLVEQVDERGQCRRLSAAGRPANEYESLVEISNFGELRRQPEVVNGRRRVGNHAEDGVVAALIEEHVSSIAAALRNRITEVELVMRLERLPLLFCED